jgi:uncharacterized protein YndB with AHSA1/START domain
MEAAQNIETNPQLMIRRVINASRERVFDAWTKPELMQQWFFAWTGTARVSNDLRVGGSYSNTMVIKAGKPSCTPDANFPGEFLHTGEYLEIRPPEKLVFTWSSHAVQNSRVTVELRDLGGKTELTLIHDLLPDQQSRDSHTEGWNSCLDNLQQHIATALQ